MTANKKSKDNDFVLIGYTQKPFGLFGELKIRPETFDFNRYTSLSKVYFRKNENEEPIALEIRGSRADAESWYFKFKDYKTPEAVAPFSGGQLLIPIEDRLELPEDMVYLSEMPGMQVVDENGDSVGPLLEIIDQGANDLLIVSTPKKEIHIPWNDHFVKKVDKEKRIITVDLSILRSIL